MSEPGTWDLRVPVTVIKMPSSISADIIWNAIFSVESLRWPLLMHARDSGAQIYAMVFLRGSDTTPDAPESNSTVQSQATQLLNAQRYYPEYRSWTARVLVCYRDGNGQNMIAKSEREIAMADGKRAVESIPGVTFFFPKDWLAGALYASVWPMSACEMGGAVDALLAVEQKEKEKAEELEKNR